MDITDIYYTIWTLTDGLCKVMFPIRVRLSLIYCDQTFIVVAFLSLIVVIFIHRELSGTDQVQ